MSEQVVSQDLERAERVLKLIGSSGIVPGIMYRTLGIDREGFEELIKHHLETLRKTYPEIDPRGEPTLNTLMFHFFMLGIVCGRKAL